MKLWYLFMLLFHLTVSDKVEDCTDVARDDETLLVFSTLGGGLTAIDPVTSEIRWKIDDEPAIKVPTPSEFSVPQYLPDPRDGSLYQLGGMGGLKKLPYTIPQLVASAPCRSSDGILYSGKKSDAWFLIDPKTGQREKVLGFGSALPSESIGWATSRSVYLGRTQYTVLMYDSLSTDKNTKPWNVTFYDYSSHTMTPDLSKNYEWLHLSSSASGLTVTLDRIKGTLLWQKDLGTPVVAVFLLGPDGLLNVPFTTVSDDALRNIVDYAKNGNKNDVQLFQTLYVGEHIHGVYAIPSLVDKNTVTISSEPPVKLLSGPPDNDEQQKLINLNNLFSKKQLNNNNKNNEVNDNNFLVLGHYQMPITNQELKLSISPTTQKSQTQDKKDIATVTHFEFINLNKNEPNFVIQTQEQQTNDVDNDNKSKTYHNNNHLNNNDNENTINENLNNVLLNFYNKTKAWFNDQENRILKLLLAVLIVLIIAMFQYTRNAFNELRQQSQNGSKTLANRNNAGNYNELEELGDGELRVGKICFNLNYVLGKGCEGTFVFKGTFEKRDVAVKRLLPECFTLADREVALLRESDTHENVVRYFCTEQDRQFRYIAVELCAATLQDYTESPISKDLKKQISTLDVLKQSTSGLMHLHSLNIVHRDIKPQNVLLSFPDANNRVRVMISDFGLCKKLNFGKASFSRRSGITGTEGWIAPEMLKGQRTTTSVDIFSLGCVFYYVLSNGNHPFGDPVKRQANILSNEFELKILATAKIMSEEVLAEELITSMIGHDQIKRPNAKAVRNHPLFWTESKILAFLQDVSDRVEKSIEPLKVLEKNAKMIVRQDWNLHLDHAVTADMRKYRGYQGGSVRDLLRAIRNKKHHYHELDPNMQTSLGGLPIEFTRYWLKRFPHLLSHSFHALEMCSNEKSFQIYYNENFTFKKPDYFSIIDIDNDNNFPTLMITGKLSPKKGEGSNDYTRNKMSNYNNNNMNKSENIQRPRKGAYNFHKVNDGISDNDNVFRQTQDTDNLNNRKNLRKKNNQQQQQQQVNWTMPNNNNN